MFSSQRAQCQIAPKGQADKCTYRITRIALFMVVVQRQDFKWMHLCREFVLKQLIKSAILQCRNF